MNKSTPNNFSIFKEKSEINDSNAPVTRAIQYNGFNIKAIEFHCKGMIYKESELIIGDWIKENHKSDPRTFELIPDLQFKKMYEECEIKGILSGGLCDHD